MKPRVSPNFCRVPLTPTLSRREMGCHHSPLPTRHSPLMRRGLAPLEMVLSLPILLFVMALMINFDTVASWKVRALSIARNAVWSTRWPRNGNAMPRPSYWPRTANVASAGIGTIPSLDDPRVNLPVARGPLPGATVLPVLDPTQGFRQGTADLQRSYPLLSKGGQYSQHAETELLDDRWEYPEMGMGSNFQQRIPVIYQLAQASQSLVQNYVSAAEAVISANQGAGLAPLDHDPEFIQYRGAAPDFHPRLQQFCSLDQQQAQTAVQNLTDNIQGKKDPHVASVAETMTRAFIGLYQGVIAQLQQSGQGNSPLIPQFQNNIKILNQFLGTL